MEEGEGDNINHWCKKMEGLNLNQWRKVTGRKVGGKGKAKYMVGRKGTKVRILSYLGKKRP